MAAGATNHQALLADLHHALDREHKNLLGQRKMEATWSLAQKAELSRTVREEIDATMARIAFLESQLQTLNVQSAIPLTSQPSRMSESATSTTAPTTRHSMHDTIPLLPFDYLKHESALTLHKVAFKLEAVKRKLAVEQKTKQQAEQSTIQLKLDLTALNADPQKIADAQLAELEANARVACLMKAELRWEQLYIPTAPNQNILEETISHSNSHNIKLMSGHLKVRVITAANLPNKSPDSVSYAVVRVDETERARTKPSSTSWNQDFDIEVSKAEQFEMGVYSDDGLLLSLIWFKLSELAEAVAAQEPHSEGIGSWFGFGKQGGLETWLDLEPAGQVLARFQFVEDKYDIQPDSGFLKRRQAVKKNVAVRGHRFQKASRGISNRCVVCEKIMLTGFACEYCKYSVHKECSEKSLTCSVNPEIEDQESEDDKKVAKHLGKHRIVHSFSPATAPIAPPCWCDQCGQVIPPLTSMRKCSACDNFTVHAVCEKLVPHFCGMSAHKADEFMREAEKIEEKKRKDLLEAEEKKRLQTAEDVRAASILQRRSRDLQKSVKRQNEIFGAPSPDGPISTKVISRTGSTSQTPTMDVLAPDTDIYVQVSQALDQRRKERDHFEARMQQATSPPVSPASSNSSLNPPNSALYDYVNEILAARDRERKSLESRLTSMTSPVSPTLSPSTNPNSIQRPPSTASVSSATSRSQSKSPLMSNAPPRTVSRQSSTDIPPFPPSPVYSESVVIDVNDPALIREQQAAFETFKHYRESSVTIPLQSPSSATSLSSLDAGPPRTVSLLNHRPLSFAQAAAGVLSQDQIKAFIAEQQRLYIQAQQSRSTSAGTSVPVTPATPVNSSSDGFGSNNNTGTGLLADTPTVEADMLPALSQEQSDYEGEIDTEDELLHDEEEEEIRLREQEERRRREALERQAMAEEAERQAREQEEASRRSMLQETAQQHIRELILAQQMAAQQRIQMETTLREAAARREQEVRMREEMHQRELQQAALARAQQEALREQHRREEYERQVRAQQLQEQMTRQQEYLATVQRHQQSLYNQQVMSMQDHQRRQQQLFIQQQQQAEHMKRFQSANGVAAAAAFIQQQQVATAQQQHLQAMQHQQTITLHSRSSIGKRKMSVRKFVNLNDFSLIAVLGKGAFGKVTLVEDKRTKELFALKSLKKEHAIENNDIESIKAELTVFRLASASRFPFLVNLYACFQTPDRLNFVMEYAAGGDLMIHLSKNGRFPRNTEGIKFYAAELLLALEFLHQHKVVYRDLKPENVLLSPEGHIKLADYGVCKENVGYGVTTRTFCGTLDTMAPEIIRGEKYTRAVDWWSFGIMLYVFVFRSYPYKGNDEGDYLKEITSKPLRFPVEPDPELKDLILKLLVVNPNRRLGSGRRDADEIKMHPWFYGVDWDALVNLRIRPPFVPHRKNPYDVGNFDMEFTKESPAFTQMRGKLSHKEQNDFNGFDYICADWGTAVSQQVLSYSAGDILR
ncbi:hypothetical protein SeMB42_g05634 [Synchytrium endobioticum]|uniref:protein kinase C n=1 Tax=Synchytrium endobioticum TaxID=286115 RepID=A0A507CQ82_9FUNG|nr:hypothetical protein SeMB42_g05634 [Synchytrium endobioticum]